MKVNKKKVEENILPSVQSTHFKLYTDAMYWIDDEGAKHKIVKAGICANGVRDLCIYWKGPNMNDVSVGKIVDVAKEHILWIPKGDILWIRFKPSLDDGRCSFYLDVGNDPKIKDMVRTMLHTFKNKKGSEYDMFGGEPYL
jgi:hypothetical protein